MKILVVRFSSLGDVVLSTPVPRLLKEKFPKSEIHFITKKAYSSIYSNNKNIDKVINFNNNLYESIQKIKDYLSSLDILNLHIMTYLLKVTGSCIVTVLCNIKKLDAMEAWESVNIEELWYNKIYNDNKKKEELDSQMAEVDFYIKLLDSI